nr:uncharacterized protein LOC112732868 [Arachis hypogaea]
MQAQIGKTQEKRNPILKTLPAGFSGDGRNSQRLRRWSQKSRNHSRLPGTQRRSSLLQRRHLRRWLVQQLTTQVAAVAWTSFFPSDQIGRTSSSGDGGPEQQDGGDDDCSDSSDGTRQSATAAASVSLRDADSTSLSWSLSPLWSRLTAAQNAKGCSTGGDSGARRDGVARCSSSSSARRRRDGGGEAQRAAQSLPCVLSSATARAARHGGAHSGLNTAARSPSFSSDQQSEILPSLLLPKQLEASAVVPEVTEPLPAARNTEAQLPSPAATPAAVVGAAAHNIGWTSSSGGGGPEQQDGGDDDCSDSSDGTRQSATAAASVSLRDADSTSLSWSLSPLWSRLTAARNAKGCSTGGDSRARRDGVARFSSSSSARRRRDGSGEAQHAAQSLPYVLSSATARAARRDGARSGLNTAARSPSLSSDQQSEILPSLLLRISS